MSTLEEISKKRILQKAMSTVEQAEKEILATMDLAEERESPLPREYFLLLQKKAREGVVVKRLAFGTKRDFESFKKEHEIRSKKYKCVLASTKSYRRMLLVDRKHLLFAVQEDGERRFYYTIGQKQVKKFLNYFQRGFRLASAED